jgi:hypothetical protein
MSPMRSAQAPRLPGAEPHSISRRDVRYAGIRLQKTGTLADAQFESTIQYFSWRKRMQLCIARSRNRNSIMLYTVAVILLILWVLGLVTSFTAGGLLHLLLVVAIVMVIFQVISGRRV